MVCVCPTSFNTAGGGHGGMGLSGRRKARIQASGLGLSRAQSTRWRRHAQAVTKVGVTQRHTASRRQCGADSVSGVTRIVLASDAHLGRPRQRRCQGHRIAHIPYRPPSTIAMPSRPPRVRSMRPGRPTRTSSRCKTPSACMFHVHGVDWSMPFAGTQ